MKDGNDHLADLAFADRIAGARLNDFDNDAFVDDHAFERRRFVSDDAQFRGGITLQHRDAARAEFVAQRRR